MVSSRPEAKWSLQAKLLFGIVHPGSNQTLPSTSKSCLMTLICWPSTNPAGCLPSPAVASWITRSCAWCRSVGRMQILFTGWAEPPAASSSSPKQLRPPPDWSRSGTLPKLRKGIGQWLKKLHCRTALKSLHPSGWYRTRASGPCGLPVPMANRPGQWPG